MTKPESLQSQIDQVCTRDRFALRKLLKSIKQARQRNKPHDQLLAKFHRDVRASLDKMRARRDALPTIRFDQDLPILQRRKDIRDAVLRHQVTVVSGETGSGKSTQLPKICLDAGLGIAGMIGHTQPRRIAARSIATRVAEELGRPLGQDVGYKIRFADRTNPRTFVKLMTDGILLAETQGDRFLEQYEVIILDEAHERSLNIDFILGYLVRLLPKRPELRLIITSATIDAERFSRHYRDRHGPAPIIEVSGRSYPVEVRYRPLEPDGETDEIDIDMQTGIARAVHELAAIDRGHILIFLPTERDIRETAKRLRAENLPGDGPRKTEVLPLYARLSAAEQNRVFQPRRYRRIVLATNVAESSLTVPGIRYVIDTGTARISRYAPRSKVQRLPIEAISRASADQRKGRCGRIAPGICVRLYSEEDYAGRAAYTTPEIQRTNLASVILQAKALKLGRVEEFPFLDAPRPETIRDGYKTLFEIGAIDARRELTDLGRRLSRLPVDPRIARIILAAEDESCLAEILIIAAALEIRDPRERPVDKQNAADEQHAKFIDDQSDFAGYLKLWDFYHELKDKLSRSKLRKACQQNFLSYNRLREWTEIHRQLMQLVTAGGLKGHARRDDHGSIHRALLTGFLSGVAYRGELYEYTGAGGVKFHLWPGSGLFQTKPKWCVVAELVETTRRYGRTAARINPNWIEPLAGHVVKRSYSEPHWHAKSASVMALERVTLFGLPIVAQRRVPYGKIDPVVSRDVMIRDGLSARQLEIADSFYVHNEKVIAQIAKLAAKTRKAQYVIDDYSLQRFYQTRIPADVYDLPSLRKWLTSLRGDDRTVLHVKIDDLVAEDREPLPADQFPDEITMGVMEVPVEYHFAPGEDNDGVTVTVPEDGVGQLQPGRMGWLVPGLLEEKVVALIRSLPKAIRRNLIPAPDTARSIVAQLDFARGDFFEQIVERLSRVAEEPIPLDALRLEKLPDHLRLNIRIVDQQGKVRAQGRELADLHQQLGVDETRDASTVEEEGWDRDGITTWDFGSLPAEIQLLRGGIQVPVYPTLIDNITDVRLRLLSSPDRSRWLTRGGLRRMYVLDQRRALRSQVRWLPRWDEICLFASPVMSQDVLLEQITDLIADRAFLGDVAPPTDEDEFGSRLANSAERIGLATQDVAKLLPHLFEGYHQARLALEERSTEKWRHALSDIQKQIASLMRDGFLAETPWRWLVEYPRYFKAIPYRLERLSSGSLERDRAATGEIDRFWQRYEDRRKYFEELDILDAELDMYRWMIEEYRVSAFAQPLGTLFAVSPKRLEKQWSKVR